MPGDSSVGGVSGPTCTTAQSGSFGFCMLFVSAHTRHAGQLTNESLRTLWHAQSWPSRNVCPELTQMYFASSPAKGLG